MKKPVSFTVPKPGLAKWGNFNHTTLIQAEVFRNLHDNVAVKTIEGMVRSSRDLNPLAGISVKLSGTNLEALTDDNGWFSIIIEKPSVAHVLLFTSDGFSTTQVPVTHEDFLHVNLKAIEPVNASQASKSWKLSTLFFW